MNQRLTSALAILLLITVGLACSILRPNHLLGRHMVLEIDASVPDRELTVKQTVKVIERRLDDVGIRNFQVLAQGTPPNGRILVNLPDSSDPERLKKLITATGRLELTAIVSPPSPAPVQTYSTRQDAVASLGGTVPPNRRVLPYSERNERASNEQTSEPTQPVKWVVVEAPAIVGGAEVRNAAAIPSPGNGKDYQITFSLGPQGAEKFGDWTKGHFNEYLGVVLNDEVKSIAFIKSQITDRGEISGRFTKQAAEDLALTLRSGALPAPVKIVEEGPNK